MNRNLRRAKPLPFKKHPQRQWFYFNGEPVGYWVKLQLHGLDCNCVEKDVELKICPRLYSCTCCDYAYGHIICSHIIRIHRSLSPVQISEIFLDEKLEIQAVAISDIIEMMSMCANDQFPYEKFFMTDEDINKRLLPLPTKLYWHGYELMLKRHDIGITYKEDEIENLDITSWKITRVTVSEMKKRRKIKGQSVTKIIPVESKTVVNVKFDGECSKCQPVKKCMVCSACIHMYKCQCQDFKNGFVCQHCHATDLKLSGYHRLSYKLKNDFLNYRREKNRDYFLHLHNRVRHNVSFFMIVKYISSGKYKGKSYSDIYDVIDKFEYKETKQYRVTHLLDVECTECDVSKSCPICRICWHYFICECADYGRGFICSHMHAVRMFNVAEAKTLSNVSTNFGEDEIMTMDDVKEILHHCLTIVNKAEKSKKRRSSRLNTRNEPILEAGPSVKNAPLQSADATDSNLQQGGLVGEAEGINLAPDSTRSVAKSRKSVTFIHEEPGCSGWKGGVCGKSNQDKPQSSGELDSVPVEMECSTDKVKILKKRRPSRFKKKNKSKSEIESSAAAASDNTADVKKSDLVEKVEGIDLKCEPTSSSEKYEPRMETVHEEESDANLDRLLQETQTLSLGESRPSGLDAEEHEKKESTDDEKNE